MTYSPDGRRLLSGGLSVDMVLWDAQTGAMFARLTGMGGERVSAAFSPDGALLLTATLNGPVAVWDMATGARHDLVTGADRPLFVDWSPDGFAMLFVDAGGPVYVWGIGGASDG